MSSGGGTTLTVGFPLAASHAPGQGATGPLPGSVLLGGDEFATGSTPLTRIRERAGYGKVFVLDFNHDGVADRVRVAPGMDPSEVLLGPDFSRFVRVPDALYATAAVVLDPEAGVLLVAKGPYGASRLVHDPTNNTGRVSGVPLGPTSFLRGLAVARTNAGKKLLVDDATGVFELPVFNGSDLGPRTRLDGLSGPVATGDLDADGMDELVAQDAHDVVVLKRDAVAWRVLHRIKLTSGDEATSNLLHAAAIVDADGDGKAEVIVGQHWHASGTGRTFVISFLSPGAHGLVARARTTPISGQLRSIDPFTLGGVPALALTLGDMRAAVLSRTAMNLTPTAAVPVGGNELVVEHDHVEFGVRPGVSAAGAVSQKLISQTLGLSLSTPNPSGVGGPVLTGELEVGVDLGVYLALDVEHRWRGPVLDQVQVEGTFSLPLRLRVDLTGRGEAVVKIPVVAPVPVAGPILAEVGGELELAVAVEGSVTAVLDLTPTVELEALWIDGGWTILPKVYLHPTLGLTGGGAVNLRVTPRLVLGLTVARVVGVEAVLGLDFERPLAGKGWTTTAFVEASAGIERLGGARVTKRVNIFTDGVPYATRVDAPPAAPNPWPASPVPSSNPAPAPSIPRVDPPGAAPVPTPLRVGTTDPLTVGAFASVPLETLPGWAITGGSAPAGMSLVDLAGRPRLEGTPTVAGLQDALLRVTGPTGPLEVALQIRVDPAFVILGPEELVVDRQVATSTLLTASRGAPSPLRWSATGLPPGATLGEDGALATFGVMAGRHAFTAVVRASNGRVAERGLVLVVR